MKYLPYGITREEMFAFTPRWDGERFDDGRPKVPDDVLDKIYKYVSITFAWGVLKGNGYFWQFLDGFECTIKEEPLVGRVTTALYAPLRPDLREYMVKVDVMKNGKIVEANAMDDLEKFRFNQLGKDEELVFKIIFFIKKSTK